MANTFSTSGTLPKGTIVKVDAIPYELLAETPITPALYSEANRLRLASTTTPSLLEAEQPTVHHSDQSLGA
jgi:hypothetical protein